MFWFCCRRKRRCDYQKMEEYTIKNGAPLRTSAINKILFPLFFLSLALQPSEVDSQPQMTSFSFAQSGVSLSPTAGVETNLFSYTPPPGFTTSMLNYIRIESGDFLWPNYDISRLRMYVDLEVVPSINFRLGCADSGLTVPWGTPLIGNTGSAGGVYLTIKVPFSTSLVVNMTQGEGDLGSHTINFVAKGVAFSSFENQINNNSVFAFPFSFAGISPPSSVTPRLRTTSIDGIVYQPFQQVQLLQSSGPGMLVFVGMQLAGQGNMSYTSGCVTASVDDNKEGMMMTMKLSHDLASFFAEDGGFGTGKWVVPIAGVTALAPILGDSLIAWRSFQEDAFVWGSNITLQWQVGDNSTTTTRRRKSDGMVSSDEFTALSPPLPPPTTVYSTVFYYSFE